MSDTRKTRDVLTTEVTTDAEREFLARFMSVVMDQYETLADASKQIGISEGLLSTWNKARYMPNMKFVLQVAHKHRINPIWLFTGQGRKYGVSGDSISSEDLKMLQSELRCLLKRIDEIQATPVETEEERTLREFEEFQKWRRQIAGETTDARRLPTGVL